MEAEAERTRLNLHINELKSADATLRNELAYLDTLPDGSEEDRLETVRNRSIEIGFDIHASEEELNGLPPSQADVIAEREAAGQQVIKLQEPK